VRIYIREHRLHLGLSVTELARRADVARQTVHVLECNPSYIPTGSVLVRLATALAVQVVDLFAPPVWPVEPMP
jgi:DNA-binding XRE family transcriptional regulator